MPRSAWALHLYHSLLEAGNGIKTAQELPVSKDVSTTMIYTHVLDEDGKGGLSPLDGIDFTAKGNVTME